MRGDSQWLSWRRWGGVGAASVLAVIALLVLARGGALAAEEYAGMKREVIEAKAAPRRVSELRKAAERRPESVEAYLELARVEARSGDSDQAIAEGLDRAQRLAHSFGLTTIFSANTEVGKLADLVVLDRNVFELPTWRIHEAKVVRTLLEGRTVLQRAGEAGTR